MTHSDNETLYYRYCRRLDGALVPIDIAVRNDRVVPRFDPTMFEPPSDAADESQEYRELLDEVCQNLNEVERRTWLLIIEDGRSILGIAADERVSRPAIYDRLRRMARKNDYVAIYWRLKNKVNQHA